MGVLAGGVSEEREISLLSGKQVFSALGKMNIPASLIDLRSTNPQEIKAIIANEKIDVVFVALHGVFGEDGQIQRILEEAQVAYTGSGPEASCLTMNKFASKERFKAAGILVPFCVFAGDIPQSKKIEFPVVIKPNISGSSLGVSIVRKKEELTTAVKEALKFSDSALAEEYIEGRELTVGILKDRPLAVIEIVSGADFFDFKNKYTKGNSSFIAPARLKSGLYKQVQEVAYAAHTSLGCRDFSRVDMRLKDGRPYIFEVNSIPGLTQQSLLPLSALACGVSFAELICVILRGALARNKALR